MKAILYMAAHIIMRVLLRSLSNFHTKTCTPVGSPSCIAEEYLSEGKIEDNILER